MNIAIIFAGGSGVRMGAGVPKQFLEINGKPILVHTLQPTLIIATLPFLSVLYTSAKSVLMYPGTVIISAIARAALATTSSDLEKAFNIFKSG